MSGVPSLHGEAEVWKTEDGWTVRCHCGHETQAFEVWKARELMAPHYELAEARRAIDKAKGE